MMTSIPYNRCRSIAYPIDSGMSANDANATTLTKSSQRGSVRKVPDSTIRVR